VHAHDPPWSDPRAAGLLPDICMGMGQTAENVATLRGISRHEQDEFALRSQQLTAKAVGTGFYAREITPVTLPDGTVVATDDSPRPDTTYSALAGLRPVFRATGTVTAGNACPLNDGAAAVVIMSDTRARELGVTPLARIVATGVSGLTRRSWDWDPSMPPDRRWHGPVSASATSTCSR
jgi:acetyl-CoA C-acetyltransferase